MASESVSLSEFVAAHLDTLSKQTSWRFRNLADSIQEQIETRIAPWMPTSERGGDGTIKWCEAISLHCNADIYRLKCPELGEWRLFFFVLDLRKPPSRHVADIVERTSNEQCYNDMGQPHVKRLRWLTAQFKNSGELRLMRKPDSHRPG